MTEEEFDYHVSCICENITQIIEQKYREQYGLFWRVALWWDENVGIRLWQVGQFIRHDLVCAIIGHKWSEWEPERNHEIRCCERAQCRAWQEREKQMIATTIIRVLIAALTLVALVALTVYGLRSNAEQEIREEEE